MAKRDKSHTIRVYRSVPRSRPGLLYLPLLLLPAVLYGMYRLAQELPALSENADATLPWYSYATAAGCLLIFPVWAWLSTRFGSRYRITLDSVIEEHGIIGRTASEIRIQDIRNIVVTQSALERVLFMGHVSFSSAAGAGVEVTFSKVARPGAIRDLVRDLQAKLSDGVLTREEASELVGAKRAASLATAPSPRSLPSPEPTRTPKPAPAPARTASAPQPSDSRDELYRLLAEQAESNEEDGTP